MKYIMQHKKYGTYFRKKDGSMRYYTLERDRAKRMTLSEIKREINRYAIPDNWEIVKVRV